MTVSLAGSGAAAAVHEATPMPSGDNDAGGPEMLFVQSFESGSVAPRAGEDGRYTVTLEHGLGQTIYFSDRPDRIVGARPTQRFLDGLGFTLDNPPNTAILTDNDNGESTIAVVELFDQVYDPDSATVTYEMAMLEHWQHSTELGFAETSLDLGAVGPSLHRRLPHSRDLLRFRTKRPRQDHRCLALRRLLLHPDGRLLPAMHPLARHDLLLGGVLDGSL